MAVDFSHGARRTQVTRTGENTATYTYDPISEVVFDLAAEGPTNRLNEQLHYVFDAVGNLNYRTNSALIENFTVNSDLPREIFEIWYMSHFLRAFATLALDAPHGGYLMG